MTPYEVRQFQKTVLRTAALRAHVREAIDEAPPTATPEFVPWFIEWQREAVRLFERYAWWDLDGKNRIHELDEQIAKEAAA